MFQLPEGRAVFVVNPLPDIESYQSTHEFMLMSVRSEGQFNSIIYEENDSYRQTPHRHCVLMNADDMSTMGLCTADKVTLRSDTGVMKKVSVYPFDLPKGNLMAYFPEANVLIGQQVDARSRTPAFKSIPVSIEIE